jgi:hypothetical protein
MMRSKCDEAVLMKLLSRSDLGLFGLEESMNDMNDNYTAVLLSKNLRITLQS